MCFPSANGLRKVIGTEPSLWALPKPLHSPGGKRKWQAREGNHTNLSPRQMKKLVNSLSNTQGVDLRFLSPLCLLWCLPQPPLTSMGMIRSLFRLGGRTSEPFSVPNICFRQQISPWTVAAAPSFVCLLMVAGFLFYWHYFTRNIFCCKASSF